MWVVTFSPWWAGLFPPGPGFGKRDFRTGAQAKRLTLSDKAAIRCSVVACSRR